MLPPACRALAERLGAISTIEEATRDQRQSSVWIVRGADGDGVIKRHRSRGKYRRERDALTALIALDPIPRLLAADDAESILLMELRPGRWTDTPMAWRAAGATLAAMHAVPTTPDPMPLADGIRARLADADRRARRVIESQIRQMVLDVVGDGAAFDGVDRVFCHRDYAPRNWHVGPDGRLSVFDLEHARSDDPLVDLLRLWDGPFVDRPDRVDAFFAGYGRPLTAAERDRLDRLRALHGLVTMTWGLTQSDPAFVDTGRVILRRIERSLASGAGSRR